MTNPDRPNIIFIVVDDCGYADLGCTGQTGYRTPALDRLAGEGVRFTQAYANAPLCTNTRVAMITGRYQYRLKIGLVEPLRGVNRGEPEMGIPPGFPTLPSLLRTAGYRTALIGKWHLGFLPDYSPLKSGYDDSLASWAASPVITRIRARVANLTCGKANCRSNGRVMSRIC